MEISREEIDLHHETAGAEIAAAIAELKPGSSGRLERVFPLAKERLYVELSGVPAAVANALRRTLQDEMRGHCLTFDGADFSRTTTTDPFMSDEDFVRTRLRSIPLRPLAPEAPEKALRLALDAENRTSTVMTVYSGDLVVVEGALGEPLFNPSHEIAFLQPGKALQIKNIRVDEGFGCACLGGDQHSAAFQVAQRCTALPLDLAKHPREATHRVSGSAAHESGYVESSLVANPRHHKIEAYLPAIPAGSEASAVVLLDACGSIMKRLRFIQNVLEKKVRAETHTEADHGARMEGAHGGVGSSYFVVTPDGSGAKGVLRVRETHTIGNLLKRAVYDLVPDIAYVAYEIPTHQGGLLVLTIKHQCSDPNEVAAILARAVKLAYQTFSRMHQGIRAKTLSRRP